MIHDISVYRSYTSFTQNLCKKYATNGRNETCSIRKSHINKFEKTMRMITNMQIDIHT